MKKRAFVLFAIFLFGVLFLSAQSAQAMTLANSECLKTFGFDPRGAKEVKDGKKTLLTLKDGVKVTLSEDNQIVAIQNPKALQEDGTQELGAHKIKQLVALVEEKLIHNPAYIRVHYYDFDGVNTIYRYERKLMANYTDPYDGYEFAINRYSGHLANFIKKYAPHPVFNEKKIMSQKEALKKGQELLELYHFQEGGHLNLTVVNPQDLRTIRGEKPVTQNKLYYAYSVDNGRQTIFMRADNGEVLGMLEYENYDEKPQQTIEESVVLRIYHWILGLFR